MVCGVWFCGGSVGVWCVVCGFVEDLWCGGWKLISIEFSAEERGKEGSTVRERCYNTLLSMETQFLEQLLLLRKWIKCIVCVTYLLALPLITRRERTK